MEGEKTVLIGIDRQCALGAKFEGEHPADIGKAFRLYVLSKYQGKGASPASIHRYILLPVDLVGNRRRDDAGLCREVPQLFAGIRSISNQGATCGALEYQVP